MNLMEKLKELADTMNNKGIPLPLFKINGKATFTGTMTFIAFNTALLGQIGKVTKALGEVDLTQANYLFLICLGAYLGNKKLSSDGKTVAIEAINKEEDK